VRRRPTGRDPKTLLILTTALILAGGSTAIFAQTPTPPPPDPVETKPNPKPATTPKDAPSPPAKTPARGLSRPSGDEPVVMSSDAMAKARGKTPEKDRYGAEPDWAEIPAWRQTSFFGIKAEGRLILYVVDCSGSMDEDDRLDKAKAELRRSINALQSPQRFKVIFYNDRPVPMPGELPKPADYPSKAQLSRWMSLVEAEGPTDPRSSLALALSLKPDAVFLLSDGAFPTGTVEAVAKLNPKKVPIHCVDLANGAAGDDLRRIATDSGGQYAARGR
jgi:hypothetical protein